MKKRILILIAIAAAAGIGAYRAAANRTNPPLVFSGTVETREIQVGSKVGGRVGRVLAEEGRMAKAGETLVTFEVEELAAQKRQVEAEIAQAKALLDKMTNGYRPQEVTQAEDAEKNQAAVLEALRNGPRPQELAQAQADLDAAKADLANLELNYQRTKKLFDNGDVARQVFDDSQLRMEAARARVASLRQRLALLEAGTRAEDIRAAEARHAQAKANAEMMRSGMRKEDIRDAEARLKQAQARLDLLDVQLAEGEVKSPTDARIEVVTVRPGDLVQAGKPVARLLELDQVWVRVYIPEPEMGRVKVGQKVSVTVDSFPNRTFEGTVEQVSAQAEFTPRNVQSRSERDHQVFGVKIRVDNRDGIFKAGMAAEVKW